MKKMTFALACASTAVLFADQTFNSIGFEAYPLTETSPSFMGLSGKTDAGEDASAAGDSFWLYDGGTSGAADGSAVKKYGTGNLESPTTGDAAGEKYLELSTEGGTLWRSINGLSSATALGEAKPVPAATGIYIDTMVQFTPTEDSGAPELDPADKIAIWLSVTTDEETKASVTNLMVKALSYTDGELTTSAPATFTLARVDGEPLVVDAGSWHRLTLQAIQNVFASVETGYLPAFTIKLDGNVELCATTTPFLQAKNTLVDPDGELLSADMKALVAANRIFPSLQGMLGEEQVAQLQGLGFKGSGAIDNVQFTDYDPNPAAPASVDFTVKVPTDATGVKYAIDGAEAKDLPDGGKIEGAAGATVTITGALADGTSFTKTGTISENGELDLSTPDWSFYLAADAEAANTYVIDSVTELVDFQKGVAAKLTTAGVTFKLGADIALTDTWTGIGLYGKDNVGNATAYDAGAFQGTFDGNAYAITGLKFQSDFAQGSATNKYIGFFFSTKNATIKNVKFGVANYGWDLGKSIGKDVGAGVVVGTAWGTTFERVEVLKGTTADTEEFYGKHAISAFAGYTTGANTFTSCTNNLNLNENRGSGAKVAAFSACNQNNSAKLVLTDCVNKGNVYSTSGEFAAGFAAYQDGEVEFTNCENTGSVTAGKAGKVAEFVASVDNKTAKNLGGSKGTGDCLATAANAVQTGFGFLDTTTKVYTDTPAVGGSYKVTSKNMTVTLANVGDSITLDTTLATATVTTTAEDAYVAKSGNVYTVTAKADAEFTVTIDPTEAEWTDTLTLPTPTITGTEATGSWSPAAIVEPEAGTTNTYTYTVTVAATDTTKETTKSVEFKVYKNATVVYPDYITDDTAKGKFDTWASDVAKIDGEARKTASMDAYLLNVAPANVDTAKAAFKIVSIEQDAEGAWTVKVTADKKTNGQAYGNGTIEVQGATTLKGPWAKDTAGAKFFKAILK